ncbi:hypothetical protein K502DRAFT_353994 [Neoconidiobolus thromboides FSU 785]|nr:hypothetical protein K502DRAFT_353994 [Neoconidiobolus thromboides FSU 785]
MAITVISSAALTESIFIMGMKVVFFFFFKYPRHYKVLQLNLQSMSHYAK